MLTWEDRHSHVGEDSLSCFLILLDVEEMLSVRADLCARKKDRPTLVPDVGMVVLRDLLQPQMSSRKNMQGIKKRR